MTRDDRDWLTDDFPELRDAPPWVMEEMIFAQARLAAPILGAERPDAARLRDAVLAAAAAGEPVVVTGCGTSEHAAMVVAELLTDSFRRAGLTARAEARQALDAALDPRSGGVLLAISHDGGTRATKLALEAGRESGARTALITACADPSCASDADLVFVTPVHDDSWCHTLAYVSAILAGARISGIAGDEAATAAADRHRVDPRPPRRPRSRRRAPGSLRSHHHRRPRRRPGERRRARPQDRRGRAHPHHRLPPRDAPARPPCRV